MKFPLIALLAVVAFLSLLYFAFKEDQRKRNLIDNGICLATTDRRTVDKGYMRCVVYGSNGICMSHMWVPRMVTETRYQCPAERFWRE